MFHHHYILSFFLRHRIIITFPIVILIPKKNPVRSHDIFLTKNGSETVSQDFMFTLWFPKHGAVQNVGTRDIHLDIHVIQWWGFPVARVPHAPRPPWPQSSCCLRGISSWCPAPPRSLRSWCVNFYDKTWGFGVIENTLVDGLLEGLILPNLLGMLRWNELCWLDSSCVNVF